MTKISPEKYMKVMTWTYIAVSALYIVIGIVLLAYPGITSLALCICLGIAVFCDGVALVVSYFDSGFPFLFRYNLVTGILLAAIGVIICCRPDAVLRVMP